MSDPHPRAESPLSSDRLAARLAEVYQVLGPVYRKAARTVEQLQPQMGMSVGVRAVLEQLRTGGEQTVPQIARRLQLSRQFVQRMTNEARSADWVQPHPNPAHRSSPLLTLTEQGAAAFDAVVEREHQLMGQVPGDLTEQDIETTLKVLRAMSAGLDEVAARPA